MMGYKIIGNTTAEWDDNVPLVVKMSEKVERSDTQHTVTITIDLSDLCQGFSEDFLIHLKDLLIEWRHKISLTSIEFHSRNLQRLLLRIIKSGSFGVKINIIDEAFLLRLHAMIKIATETQLKTLRSMFRAAPYSPLWAPSLHYDYFPRVKGKKGHYGQQISRILERALTRTTCVHILSRLEQAYDLGEMDIGLFSFANLAFAVFCRPESYRQIQLGDLVFDEKSNAYLLYILPAKSRVKNPAKICYKINKLLGMLLQKQRQSVVDKYSYLVDKKDVNKLALFPARMLKPDNSGWTHEYANENFGMYETTEAFGLGYSRRIQHRFLDTGLSIGANVLRHTVGTQLAQTGASSRTIGAVLKHASDYVCKAYVDIAFHGLIETLSDAMRPAFDSHLPVFIRFRSKTDPVDAAHAIRSDDPETGQIELTGECGKLIQCEYAPITCYGCARFTPCWDADHGVNLAKVQRDIEDYKRRGKPFEHLVERAQTAKHQITLVMNAADRYQQASVSEGQL